MLKEIIAVRFQSSHGGEYDVRTSETSVDNHFTRQYIPEDNSEHEIIAVYSENQTKPINTNAVLLIV
jgi:hypothetical protein